MITITCPWCEQDEPLAFDDADELASFFTCPDCGTSVRFVEEPAGSLEQPVSLRAAA